MNAAIPAVRIEELRPDLEARVADFLLAHDDATVFHEPWFARVLTESYGHACDYWVALQAERVVGVFPVVTVAHPLLGRKAVAMPYQFHSGPPLAAAEDVYVALVEAAKARVVDRGVAYFEIRNHVEAPLLERLGFVAQDTQLTKTMVPLAGLAIAQSAARPQEGTQESAGRGRAHRGGCVDRGACGRSAASTCRKGATSPARRQAGPTSRACIAWPATATGC